MKITSPAFVQRGRIPSKYTCDGVNVNPKLLIEEIPTSTISLVLIIDDPDSPMGNWTHWILFNISPYIKVIEENSVPQGAIQGANTWGKNKYGGPCPGKGIHRYVFKLYALRSILNLKEGASKSEVENAMNGKILAEASLTGLYERA